MAPRGTRLLAPAAFGALLASCANAPTSTNASASATAAIRLAPAPTTAAASSVAPLAPAGSASAATGAVPASSPKHRYLNDIARDVSSIAEMKADALAHRADYDGKPLSIDGYFVKREEIHHGSGEHIRYVFYDAFVGESSDPATHADRTNLLRCNVGEGFPAFEPLDPVTIQGTAQVDSTTMLYDKNELRLEKCTIKKRAP